MKYFELAAALLLCGGAHAATYVYQANAYQQHGGRCGGDLLPFQLTVVTRKPLPLNSTVDAPIKFVSVNAGGNYQWFRRFSKMSGEEERFTTDANGAITAWSVGVTKRGGRFVSTVNDADGVMDEVYFGCGAAEVDGDPGVWTRTE